MTGLEFTSAGCTFTGRRFAEQSEALPDSQNPVFGPCSRVGVVPFRPTDRTEQYGVGIVAKLDRLIRQRSSEVVNGVAAHPALFEVEAVVEASADRVEDLHRLGDHFGAYAISGQYGYLEFHFEGISLVCIGGAPRVLYRQFTLKGSPRWQ